MATQEAPVSFQEQTRTVINDVRCAFAAVVQRLPMTPGRPSDLHKILGIDRKLGWKISKVLAEEDLLLAAQHMPGALGVRSFLDAAAERGVPTELIKHAGRAGEDFQQLVTVHADQRASFDRMLVGCASTKSEQLALTNRKAAVEANSFIWGVRARTQFAAYFLSASEDPSQVDIAGVRGFVDFRPFRPDTSWVIARVGHFDDDHRESSPPSSEPLTAQASAGPHAAAVPLLPEFCSAPLPEIREVCAPDGCLEYQLADMPVGNTGALTCITGEISRAVGTRYRDAQNRLAKFIARLRTPVDTLLMDVFMPADLFGRLEPELLVYGDLNASTSAGDAERQPGELLEIAEGEEVRHLGRGLATAYTPHVPRYTELAAYVFQRLGWRADEFEHYRARIEYPVIPTTVKVCFPLPEAPKA
jgi:hypothetical protein